MTCRICVYFRQRCPRVIVETPPFGHCGRGEGAKSGVGSSVVMTTEPPNVLQATALRWHFTEIGELLVFVIVWVIAVYVYTFSVFTWLNMGCKLSFLSSKQVGSSSVLLGFSSIFCDFSSIYPPKTPSLLHQNRHFRVFATKPRKRKNVKMNDVWWKIFFLFFFAGRCFTHSLCIWYYKRNNILYII